jgi:hypothetical protein
MHNIFFTDYRHGLTPGMKIPAFGQSNHFIGNFAKAFGFSLSGFDAAVFEQRSYHVPKHRLSMGRGSVQL